jgi:hypothetical protein
MLLKRIQYVLENVNDLFVVDTGDDLEIARENTTEILVIEYDEIIDFIEILQDVLKSQKS